MLNRVCIMGRLTKNVELKSVGTAGDVAVGSFSIAVDRDYKDSKTQERPTDFFDVTVWRGLAEFTFRNFHKGDMAILDGRLELQRWTDGDGIKRQRVLIKADDVYFGGKKFRADGEEQGENGDPNEPLPEEGEEIEMPPDDNLPF